MGAEQAGLIYNIDPQYIAVPNTPEGLRLFKNSLDGFYYVKKPDGTLELFSTGSSASANGGFANVGWNGNVTSMVVNQVYQLITGDPTRFSSTNDFQQGNANELSIEYIGTNNAIVKIELDSTHSSATTTFLKFGIFKNGVLINDSEFESPVNLNRNIGRSVTIQTGVNNGDVFDIRVLSNAASATTTFRFISLIAIKLKQE